MIWEEILKRFESGMLPFTWCDTLHTDTQDENGNLKLGFIPAILELSGFNHSLRSRKDSPSLCGIAFHGSDNVTIFALLGIRIAKGEDTLTIEGAINLIKILSTHERNRKIKESMALND